MWFCIKLLHVYGSGITWGTNNIKSVTNYSMPMHGKYIIIFKNFYTLSYICYYHIKKNKTYYFVPLVKFNTHYDFIYIQDLTFERFNLFFIP